MLPLQGTAADHLFEHGAQVRGRVLCAVDLGSQMGLNDFISFIDGGGGHPEVDAKTYYIAVPYVLVHIKGGQLR